MPGPAAAAQRQRDHESHLRTAHTQGMRTGSGRLSRRLRHSCVHLTAFKTAPAATSDGEVDRPGQSVLARTVESAPMQTMSRGRIPTRVPITDRAAVQAVLARDGVVIITDLPGNEEDAGYWADIAGRLPALTFGDAVIPGEPPVACMHQEFARNSQLRKLQVLDGKEQDVLNKISADELLAAAEREGWQPYTEIPWKNGVRQNPHTDGYVYGDFVPDHIFLLIERQNDVGGDSFFVDGEAVLERLRAEPDADILLPLLATLVYDQTESAANGGMYQGRESKGPLFSRRSGGRLQWKRMLGQDQLQNRVEMKQVPIPRSCWAATDETHATATKLGAEVSPEELLRRVDLAIHAESEVAGRVRLEKGEAVCIDNYRILHAREAFGGSGDRRLWRIWTWTTGSDGRPNGDAAPVSTPLDIHLELTKASRPVTLQMQQTAGVEQ
eukprot:SAG31_NODE_714_length_12645_cov_15.347760_9_plen_441_part_00